ncbi:MAG: methyltransferase domain-containing protein [Ktedonobacteraceae bacterium]|nr:methyltransferase domain-containing protein [Ktedonobacteraceae bacterium]MBO0794641.1 methyltransferase domain-containing protein [Ktedonobacteraceae bacterium]
MSNHFAQLARSYDELRNPDTALRESVEMLVAAGDLRGRHTLDIGCGTGRILSILARDYSVHGWGIDASGEMLAVARANLPKHINVQQATAESLPFPDQFFERVYMTMVVHLLDRTRTFSEIARVLQAGGRLAIITTDPDSLAESWMASLFPSYPSIDAARFPSGITLEQELAESGFTQCQHVIVNSARSYGKAEALNKLRQRFVSTLSLLPEDEFQAGLVRAERELPDPVEYTVSSLLVSAQRAG